MGKMNGEVFEDAFNLLCGEKIGAGVARTVFGCALIPGYVVKVEQDQSRHQNILEWEIWRSVEGTAASRWFAECKWISQNGKILIQERTRPASNAALLSMVPVWFTDIKRSNWGVVVADDGKTEYLVCHDYGVSNIIEIGTNAKRMAKDSRMQKVYWDN